MSSNTNIGNTPVNQGYVQLIHMGETGGIDGTLRALYDGDGTASDLLIASDKVKISTTLYIGSDTLAEYIQDTVGAMFSGNTETNITVTYQDGDGTIVLVSSGEVTLTGSETLTNKTLTAPTLTGTTQGASITLSGDLTVNGTTTTVNQTNLDVSDNIIGLNRGAGSNANDSGLIIERGSTGNNAAIIWDESADKFTLGTTTSTPSATGDLTISTGTLVANLEGNVTGNVTGNADTATKIASITNSDIVQLTSSQTLSNKTLTSPVIDSVTISTIQTGSESFADNDTSLMTSAAVQDKITSYGYTTNTGDITGVDLTGGTGISIGSETNTTSGAYSSTISLSHLGLEDLSDPNDDRILFWDDSVGDVEWLDIGSNISISGSTISATNTTYASDDFDHDALINFVANEHIDWTASSAGTIHASNYTDTVTTIDGTTANGVLTYGGTNNIDTEANLTFDGSTLALTGDLNVGSGDFFVDDSAGNVGIGTTSPTDTLQVDGSIGVGVGRDGQLTSVNNGLVMRSLVSDADMYFYVNDGGVDTLAMKIDGSAVGNVSLPNDNQGLHIGASGDLQIYHQSDHNYILTQKVDADLFIRQNTSGGYINAIQIDGSDAGTAIFNHDVKVNDDGKLTAGTGNDLQIYHDGTNSYLKVDYSSGGTTRTSEINMYDSSDGSMKFKTDNASTGGIEFWTEGTQRMEVQRDGNVGIGTSSPSYKLDITHAGSGLRLNSSADQQLRFERTSGNAFSIEHDTARMYLYNRTTSAAAIAVTNAGNFGIGTVSPSSPLNVKSNSSSSSDSGITITQNGGSNAIFKMGEKSTDGGRFHMYDGGVEKIAFYTDGTANHISAGNVGIGTASPAQDLTIYEDSGDCNVLISSNNGASQVFFGDTEDDNIGIIRYDHSDNSMRFTTNTTEAMRIDSSGHIGVGTASPGYIFHTHDGSSDSRHKVSTSSHGTYFESGVTADSAGILLVAGHASSILNVYLQGSGGVSNEFQFQHDGDFHADGDVVAYSTTVSDKRLKDNVKTIDSALDKVMKLRGVEFDWNQGKRKGTHDLGLIAQEVEEVLPELVREKTLCTGEYEDNEKEFKTVDYDKIVGVLIEAIKEQQEEIDLLKANYDQLKYNRR